MSQPIKRSFLQNDHLHNNPPEEQCGFSTTSVKRIRYDQSDLRDVSGALHSTFIPHEAIQAEAFNLTNIDAFSRSIIEPEANISFNDDIEWPCDLQNNLTFQLPGFISLYESASSSHEPVTAESTWSCAEATASFLQLPVTSEYAELNELVLRQIDTDDTFQLGFGNVHQAENLPQTWDYFQTNIDMSWMNNVSWDPWDNLDWVDSQSSQAASLPLLPAVAQSEVSQSEESTSSPRNCLPAKPYREILPLLQKQLTPGRLQGDEATLNVAESSKRYTISKNLKSSGKARLGRSKSFAPERASAIAEMRIIKACLRCRIKKVSCSPGEVCDACLTSAFGLERTLCVRNNVDHSTQLLFPSIVNSNFHKSRIESLVHENVESFCGNKILIQISSGAAYPPISLWVEEFRPINDNFLALPHVKTDKDGKIESRFMRGYTPPLALPPDAGELLREKCREHINLIAQGPRSEGELYYKHTSIVPWEVYKAIEKYHRSTKDELVGKSMVLYAMHFFMTQILLFTEDSADSALKNLSHPTKFPYTRSLTSRLISLQIKREMYELAHKATKEVLKLLEDTMIDGSKNPKLWGPSFCAVSILCICVETVQIATDFKIVHSIIEDDNSSDKSRGESKVQCQRLDEYVMSTLETMFHRVFKSRKKLGSRKHERGFNPIRDALDLNEVRGIDTAEAELVAEVRRIIVERGLYGLHYSRNALRIAETEIDNRLETPTFDTDSDHPNNLLKKHLIFREKNSGRLVSRFLRSFFKSE